MVAKLACELRAAFEPRQWLTSVLLLRRRSAAARSRVAKISRREKIEYAERQCEALNPQKVAIEVFMEACGNGELDVAGALYYILAVTKDWSPPIKSGHSGGASSA
jgi:hypothetical protein